LDSFVKENFIANYIFNDNMDELMGQLNIFHILAIFPGTETSIYLTDKLSEKFGLKKK
jgi:hypothetical protein